MIPYRDISGTQFRLPTNTGYVLATAANWAALPTGDYLQAGDRAAVDDLGFTPSNGVARWSGSQWELIEGYFATVANMNAFPEPIRVGAVALVNTGAALNPNAVTYAYTGSWTRFVAGSDGYAWPITDLTVTDPSGVGATKIGDFGKYTDPTTGAIRDYRLRAVSVDAAIGGGTITMWVPVAIYGEAGLTIRGYLLGTETIPARGGTIQGYTVGGGGAGSVSTSAGEVVLTCTTAGNFASLQSTYVVQPSDKVYIRQRLRITQAAATNVTYYQLIYSNGTTQPQFVMTQNPTFTSGSLIPSTTANVLVGSTLMIRGGGSPLASVTPEFVEIQADGATTDMVNVHRGARMYFSIRRNAQTGTATGQHLIQVLSGATGVCTAQVSQQYFMTY